jgi:LCP family protein required for cell wall assembly
VIYDGRHRDDDKPRRPLLRAIAISVAVVLVALLGGGFVVYRDLEGNITESPAFEEILGTRPEVVETDTGPHGPLNVLILGDDTRVGQHSVPGADATPGLSDTTILLHVSADRKRAYMVSIPRDLMVPRPDCRSKTDKSQVVPGADVAQWNAAYALGGPACTIAQFEEMTDIRVDHFVVVRFDSFRNMVDALGGVEICVPEEVDDQIGKIYLPEGRYKATGQQALDYVRVRHVLSDNGDIGRMKRQQAFLAAMTNKAISKGTLLNPVRLYGFLDAATKSLTTDPGLRKLSDLVELGMQLQDIGLDQIQFLTMPIGPYPPDINRLAPGEGADRLWNALRHDRRPPPALTRSATRASDGTPGGTKKQQQATDPGREAEAAENGLCA